MRKDKPIRINNASNTAEMIKNKCSIINALLSQKGAQVKMQYSNQPKSEKYLYQVDSKGKIIGTRLICPNQKQLILNMDAVIYGLQTLDVK